MDIRAEGEGGKHSLASWLLMFDFLYVRLVFVTDFARTAAAFVYPDLILLSLLK